MLGFLALMALASFGFSKLKPKKSEAKMSSLANLNNWVGKEVGATEVTGGWEVTVSGLSGDYKSSNAVKELPDGKKDHWILWSQVDTKSTSADTFWRTESYIVTEKKIADKNYNIGNGGAQFKQKRYVLCSKNLSKGKIWTLHGTPYEPLRKAIDEEQVKHPYHFRENVKDGVVTVWVQPVMMTSVDGKVKNDIRDLKTWQDTKIWTNEHLFKNHYDKIVQFKDNDKEAIQVKVHYVKRDGEEIDTKQKIIDSNVIKNVQIGKTIKLGDKLKNLKGDSIDVLNDHCEIKDKDGKKYVISKTFARFAKSKEQQDFVGSQTGSVADAKTDKDKKVLAKTTTGINAGMAPESGKELPLDKWFGFVKSAKVRGSLQDLEIFLCYDEVKEEESGITVNYKKIVYPKGSDKAEFVKAKNSWKVKKS